MKMEKQYGHILFQAKEILVAAEVIAIITSMIDEMAKFTVYAMRVIKIFT